MDFLGLDLDGIEGAFGVLWVWARDLTWLRAAGYLVCLISGEVFRRRLRMKEFLVMSFSSSRRCLLRSMAVVPMFLARVSLLS